MLLSVHIAGFRGFKKFVLHDLGYVNLLVGANNSGKTALLEAIELMVSGDPTTLVASMSRRGELLFRGSRLSARPEADYEIRRLFNGFKLDNGVSFSLTGTTEKRRSLQAGATLRVRAGASSEAQSDAQQASLFAEGASDASLLTAVVSGQELSPSLLELWLSVDGKERSRAFPVAETGGIADRDFRVRAHLDPSMREQGPTVFLPTSSLAPLQVVQLAEAIELKPGERLVLEALQIIEPRIQAFRVQSNIRMLANSVAYGREGVIVKLDGYDDPVPIGSLGEGTYRLLGLALALVNARGGVLLVDEIDTGLHYTVMDKMWQMVKETARRLNIQVFATTHSRDCVESLATIISPTSTDTRGITIQRIEHGRDRSVAFSEQEIALIAERGHEVR